MGFLSWGSLKQKQKQKKTTQVSSANDMTIAVSKMKSQIFQLVIKKQNQKLQQGS